LTPNPCERDFWWDVGRATFGILAKAAFRLRVVGTANVPLGGGALLAGRRPTLARKAEGGGGTPRCGSRGVGSSRSGRPSRCRWRRLKLLKRLFGACLPDLGLEPLYEESVD
jgi:hypothetical protein